MEERRHVIAVYRRVTNVIWQRLSPTLSPMKAARFQSNFTFFDPEKFGESVIYMDIGEVIRREGLAPALEIMADMLRETQPYLAVIDSFKAIHDLAQSQSEMRTFVYDVAIELAAMQIQTLLIGEYDESELAELPEFAVADGIIWLWQQVENQRTQRFLRVMKMRGTSHSDRAYAFGITKDGVKILALPEIANPTGSLRGELIPSGIEELDFLLRGGVPRGGTVLVSGQAGTGKSTAALEFIYEGLEKQGEPAVYVSYEETPEQLISRAAGFGWDLKKHLDSGRFFIDYTNLLDINVPEQLSKIATEIQRLGAKRAVVDSITMLMHQIDNPDMVREYIFGLSAIFVNTGCAAYIISDPPVGSDQISRFGVEESIVDGVIVLRLVKEKAARVRTIEVLKMRATAHATGDHLMKITSEGVKVFPRSEEVVR